MSEIFMKRDVKQHTINQPKFDLEIVRIKTEKNSFIKLIFMTRVKRFVPASLKYNVRIYMYSKLCNSK